jgi:hypothetical protein
LHQTQRHRRRSTSMSSKLSYYICLVTKNGKTEEYGYGLPYKEIMEAVEQHYSDGADAVEMEMITEDEFNDRLPKPY